MRYTQLGERGPRVSRIAFGNWSAGEGAGLDPADVFWVLKRFAPALEARRAGIVEDRHTPPQFALRDLRKDLDFALAVFGRGDAPTPLTRSSSELVTAAAAMTPDLDISAVARPYRQVGRSLTAAGRFSGGRRATGTRTRAAATSSCRPP